MLEKLTTFHDLRPIHVKVNLVKFYEVVLREANVLPTTSPSFIKIEIQKFKKNFIPFFCYPCSHIFANSLLHELAQRRSSTYLVSKRNRGGILFLGPQFYQEKIRF